MIKQAMLISKSKPLTKWRCLSTMSFQPPIMTIWWTQSQDGEQGTIDPPGWINELSCLTVMAIYIWRHQTRIDQLPYLPSVWALITPSKIPLKHLPNTQRMSLDPIPELAWQILLCLHSGTNSQQALHNGMTAYPTSQALYKQERQGKWWT